MDRWLEQKKDHPVNDFCMEVVIPHFSIIDINPSGYKSNDLYPTWKYKIRTKRGRELIFPEEWRASNDPAISLFFFFISSRIIDRPEWMKYSWA